MSEQRSSDKKRKRLKIGRDFHAWAWKSDDPWFRGFHYYAEPSIPGRRRFHNDHCEGSPGKWGRVRFVEVKS
jgi:hypothetical protein